MAGQWSRLSAFRRSCVGLSVAVLMAYVVIHFKVRPLQQQRLDLERTLESRGVPIAVPRPADDNDLQETLLKIESLEDSLQRTRHLTTQTIAETGAASQREEGRVVGVFDKLVLENGLDLLNRKRNACKDADIIRGLAITEYTCVLAGSFEQTRAFLQSLGTFNYPCHIAKLSVRVHSSGDGTRPGRSPALLIEFPLRLFFVKEDR